MARAVAMRRTTQSNTQQPGVAAGGTMGGRPKAASSRPGSKPMMIGDEVYLWVLVIIEVLIMGWLRKANRRHHGG